MQCYCGLYHAEIRAYVAAACREATHKRRPHFGGKRFETVKVEMPYVGRTMDVVQIYVSHVF